MPKNTKNIELTANNARLLGGNMMYKTLEKIFRRYENSKINGMGVFVFNNYSTYKSDEPHIEECYCGIDIEDVYNSLKSFFDEVKVYESEDAFINDLSYLKSKKAVYIYTMAQNITGYARRTLVPSICEYYGFYNVTSNTNSSLIGVNKKVAFSLLKDKLKAHMPTTQFITFKNFHKIETFLKKCKDKLIIKPDCESCCIDVEVFKKCETKKIREYVKRMLEKYTSVMLQEFIEGREIGVTVIEFNQKYYTTKPIELIYRNNKNYLTNTDSRYSNFTLREYDGDARDIIKISIKIMRELQFESIARIDFKLDKNGKAYFFDISPNPTISRGSSCNMSFINTFNSDCLGIYKFLVIKKAIQTNAQFRQT